MMLLLRGNNFENAVKIFYKLYENQNSIAGIPKWEDLSLFVDHCIENKAPAQAIVSRHNDCIDTYYIKINYRFV